MLRKDIVTKLTRRNKLIKNAIDLTILSEHEAKSGCFLKAVRETPFLKCPLYLGIARLGRRM